MKKTSTMAKNFTSKELTKTKSSTKCVAGNAGGKTSSQKRPEKNVRKESSPLNEHRAMKEPVKNKHTKQKNAMKAANNFAKIGKGTSLKERRRAMT